MEIDITKLKTTVIEKNMTFEALAYEMGIARSTLYRKLKKGTAGITLKDMQKISSCLGLSCKEADGIFGGHHGARM